MKPARSLVERAIQRHAANCEHMLALAADAEARGRFDSAGILRHCAEYDSLTAFHLAETALSSKDSRKKVIHRTEGFAVSDTANLSHR